MGIFSFLLFYHTTKNIVYLKNKKGRTSVKPQYTTLNYKTIQAVKQHLPDALVFNPG